MLAHLEELQWETRFGTSEFMFTRSETKWNQGGVLFGVWPS